MGVLKSYGGFGCSYGKGHGVSLIPAFSFMARAIELATKAQLEGEVPVGAVIVLDRRIIAESHNMVEQRHDPTAHAEMLVIRRAAELIGDSRLRDCDLYVTLEPCTMCAGAISHARLRRVFYGAYDPKGGAIDHGVRFFRQSSCLHRPEVYSGIDEMKCGQLLKSFFNDKR